VKESIEIFGAECKRYKAGVSSLILFEEYFFIHPLNIKSKDWLKILKNIPPVRVNNIHSENFYVPRSMGVILSCEAFNKREIYQYLRLFEESIDKDLLNKFTEALRSYVIERTDIFEAALASGGSYILYGLCKFYCKKEEIDFRAKYLNANHTSESIFYDIELEEDNSDYEMDCDDEKSSSDWDDGVFI
jgi:hypothetical protein